MGLKVAIVGLADDTRGEIPWDSDWEIWGLPWDGDYARYDRLFEIHDIRMLSDSHMNRLEDVWVPLYMMYGDLPNATPYPFDEVVGMVGDYFESSLSYMVALAIFEGAEEIGLWGVTMSDDYWLQRPNMEYLLGFAKGRGIKVSIPDKCPLLKHETERYGTWQ